MTSESEKIQVLSSKNSINIEARSLAPKVELSALDTQAVTLDQSIQRVVVAKEPIPTNDPEQIYPKFDDMRFPRIALILLR
jgi:hypothetical protein